MRPFCSRLTCFYLTALFAFAAASPAGEELMPLAPGNLSDSLAETGTASRRWDDGGAQAKPAVKVNVVKLTLPAIVKQPSAAKVVHAESYVREAAGTADILSPSRLTATVPSSPTPTPRGIVATAPATFSPIDHMAEIPGLITPEVIATGTPARAFTATTYSAGRDDLLDLVPDIGGSVPGSLSISPALPAMPARHDDRISTLESFALEPAPRKPRPEKINMPPPIASEAGLGFPGFSDLSPMEGAAAAPLAAHPAPAPAVRTVAAGPVTPGSLRPPTAAAKPATTPPVQPLGPMPTTSSLLGAPLGLTLTASAPTTWRSAPTRDPGASRSRQQSGFMDLPPPSSRARQAPVPAPRQEPPPPRHAPPLSERTVPSAEPDDENGFTMMRGVKNLLGP